MLPGLHKLLESVPSEYRHGWVAKPVLLQGKEKTGERTRPMKNDLTVLARDYGNSAIGRAFGYSDVAVGKWLQATGIVRSESSPRWPTEEVPQLKITKVIQTVEDAFSLPYSPTEFRPTTERVSRIICKIGEKARIVVVEPDKQSGRRLKYASAHDIRRGCASRLFDLGVSTETLRIVLRHADFSTTERHYGAVRGAQSAASEIEQKLNQRLVPPPSDKLSQLNEGQLKKLKELLDSI
jgi:integrase